MLDTLLAIILGLCVGILISTFAMWLPIYLKAQEQFWLTHLISEHHLISKEALNEQDVRISKAALWDRCRSILLKDVWCSKGSFVIILGSIAIALFLFKAEGLTVKTLLWALFAWALLTLGAIDLKTSLLPDALTLPLMWLGVGIQLFPSLITIGLEESVLGVFFAYLPLWLFTKLYGLIRHQEGLGFGDIKLLAAIGAWTGPWLLPAILFIASLLALSYRLFVFFMYRKGSRHEPFPFGPWLVLATFLILTALRLR